MLRTETRARARALQLLYAWDVRDDATLEGLAFRFNQLDGRLSKQLDAAEPAAADVIRNVDQLDAEIIAVAENWRLERIGVVERNILRLALHEMRTVGTPAKVAIDEAVKLAHWFAGSKAPGFINGVLDALARKLGYL